MIDVLPRQQLLAQWRELNSIFKKQDKHILINFVYNYPKEHLLTYSNLIIREMKNRGYKIRTMDNYYNYFTNLISAEKITPIIIQHCFREKMDNMYLRECLYNLEEKAICGGITKQEWQKIYDKYKDKFDLWKGE